MRATNVRWNDLHRRAMITASQIHTAIDFYERHPISAQTILTKLETARGTLEGLLPDELFPHDQDHYGGIMLAPPVAKV
jgi:hypothetical protein